MRCCLLLHKVSKVPVRDVVPLSSLLYHPRYSMYHKKSLSVHFDVVNDKNRFLSLQLILEKLSGCVGRRQYKMNSNLSNYFEKLKELGIDWHELKLLSREELLELFRHIKVNHAERAVLLTILEVKLCGVLCRSSTRYSTNICMNHGHAEHGWRCGKNGHTCDVYFEGKQRANTAALQIANRSFLREAKRDGIYVDVRSSPNFSIVGRLQEDLNPRIWQTPESPNFMVSIIGYEFRVHPCDPRVSPQIEEAAGEWELHAAVVKQILWEMLETNAVERAPQPLDLRPGEVGEPDSPQSFSSSFTTEWGNSCEGSDAAEEKVIVEQRMMMADGEERPWFHPPLQQKYADGVPMILPFAPSVVIKSSFRQIQRHSFSEDISKQLMQPVLDISCLVHPEACFWWSQEIEERCVRQILDYAKRVPFALPFYLYFRVDSSKQMRIHPEIQERKDAMLKEKSKWFDLRHFREVYSRQ
ncbi:unnamed protein product [Phytomonas sp. EM1]|nr:unnamed protein product [Phytomonas sp. EM1]|eukprot:CCW63467.1 unnamed protein product [Phytomonas sp. isolate EM1]